MEYRRRRSTSRRGGRRRMNESAGGAFRALILLVIFGATVYLIFGTGIGKSIKEGYALSLLSGCSGATQAPTAYPSYEPSVTADPTPLPTAAPTGETAEVKLPSIGIYMLQMGFYKSEAECASAAQSLKAQGAAGYVYNDNGSLRLIAAAFSDADSAESVRGRLADEGLECTVYKLERSGVELMVTAAGERLLPIRTAFALCADAVDQLDEISIDFDAESRSVEYGIGLLSELRTNIRSAASGISDSAEVNEMLAHVLHYFDSLTETISKTADSASSRIEFASALKSLRIEAALEYVELLQNIGA